MTVLFFVSLFAFIVILFGGLFVSIIICSMFTWHDDNILYVILNFIADYIYFFIPIIILIGFIVIFVMCVKTTLDYIENIMNAINQVNEDNDKSIVLDRNLEEIEILMNEMKDNVRRNKKRAQENEQRKNDLIVYLAHDLKTPLTSTIGYISLVNDECDMPEELRKKYLKIAYDKALRLSSLIDEFFEITKYNFSDMILTKGKVNLNLMLEQMLFEYKPLMTEKNVTYEYSGENVAVSVDSDKMQRAFDNLIKNAINYCYYDSVIFVRLVVSNKICITFENAGPTIPKEKLDKIFERFVRLDDARQTKTGGSGLGLAITKEIVEAHGGTICVNSKDEKVSFVITLPLS